MKLIFLYGPPASGKLTIAEKLSALTGAKIFHNHLSNDLVYEFFQRSKQTSKLVNKIRLDIFAEAAKQDIDLIFTYLYVSKTDDDEVKRYAKTVEDNGGQVCFVQINCPTKELSKRVTEKSRTRFRKIDTKKRLLEVLDELELDKPIPFVDNLIIDSSKGSAKKSAKEIVNHFNIQ